MSLITWVLVDDRIGNSNQARALAKLLNLSYIEKRLEYSKLALLPYFIRSGLKTLKKNSVPALLTGNPDLIIASGRRASRVAVSLKKTFVNSKIIQILNPELSYKYFDIVILPEHDKRIYKKYPGNVLFSYGALSYFSSEELEEASLKWKQHFSKYQKPYIAILIGGNSRKCKFGNNHTLELIDLLCKIPNWFKGTLLITTSRRTPIVLVKRLKEKLDTIGIKYYFYDPHEGGDNPYQALLNDAKYIIVTGDSISMCSEACSLDKPVFIYAKKDMISAKHMRFVENLYQSGLARPLVENLESWKNTGNKRNASLILEIKERLNI